MITNNARKNTGLVLAGLALILFQYPSAPRSARTGDIAAGELISTQNEVLILNTTPCESGRRLVAFHQPYRVIRKDTGMCKTGDGSRQYTRVQIEQQ